MLNKLNKKQKNILKVFIIAVSFVSNIITYLIGLYFYTIVQLFLYYFDDFSLIAALDHSEQLAVFASPEVWGWFVIISTILSLSAMITYIVLSIKSMKMYGITKKLCIYSIVFTVLYKFLYYLPMIISDLA